MLARRIETRRRVNKFRYLGVDFDHEYDDKTHIEQRKRATQAALAKLKNLEIINEKTGPYLKGHLYKTFIMPVLYYGMETIKLSKTNLNLIKVFESKIIRSIYGIPKICRTTNLRLINNINDTITKLKVMHIEFLERLLANTFTKDLFKDLLLSNKNEDYVSSVLNVLNEVDLEEDWSLIEKYYKYVSSLEFETNKKNNLTLIQLRDIFDKDHGNSVKLYEILRFDKQ